MRKKGSPRSEPIFQEHPSGRSSNPVLSVKVVMIVTILEDSNNKPGKHKIKNDFWAQNGIEVIRQRLPVGDYALMNDKIRDVFARKEKRGIPVKMMDLLGTYDVVIDSKRDILELVGDVCGEAHDRFRDECILAQNNGIRLIVLVENEDGITDLRDLHSWVNPRLFIRKLGRQVYPKAVRGQTLMKACMTMEKKYGVKFLFCHPYEAGQRILELLRGDEYGYS